MLRGDGDDIWLRGFEGVDSFMPRSIPEAERLFHRKTAAKCFNSTWDYLVKKKRSREDDRQMLLLAHASRYHWGLVGTARNRMVGDWQLSRVYSDLKHPELAVRFAKAALDTCKESNLSEFLPSIYEGMARAYAVFHNRKLARKYIGMARKNLLLVNDREDRKIFEGQIQDTEELIRKKDLL